MGGNSSTVLPSPRCLSRDDGNGSGTFNPKFKSKPVCVFKFGIVSMTFDCEKIITLIFLGLTSKLSLLRDKYFDNQNMLNGRHKQ